MRVCARKTCVCMYACISCIEQLLLIVNNRHNMLNSCRLVLCTGVFNFNSPSLLRTISFLNLYFRIILFYYYRTNIYFIQLKVFISESVFYHFRISFKDFKKYELDQLSLAKCIQKVLHFLILTTLMKSIKDFVLTQLLFIRITFQLLGMLFLRF